MLHSTSSNGQRAVCLSPSMIRNAPGLSTSGGPTVATCMSLRTWRKALLSRCASSPAFSPSGSFQRSSTCAGRSKQTALLTTVLPPTHMPWTTRKLKSVEKLSAPFA